ncbi:MAG: Hpt domain-containing protein, partial [Lachnospiraceae bacterium]|nr:Hpt domain-containing protein [Lachnospiraceae bacterium]
LLDEPWIDVEKGVANSGSMEAYLPVLKVFYNSLSDQAAEIDRLYQDGDVKGYTVKVHAIKSSAKLIGAMSFAEDAQALEDAGKREDADYIRTHHAVFMDTLYGFKDPLDRVFGTQEAEGKPEADPQLMEVCFEEIAKAAEDFDLNAIEDIFAELEDYSIAAAYRPLWEELKGRMAKFDYDGMLAALKEARMRPR